MRRSDELPDVAEISGHEGVLRVVAVLEDINEGCAGQGRSVCVHDDALQKWEGGATASEEVVEVDGVEAP